MLESFRGGNSRLLARQLDQLSWPVVVLDQRLEIVFASAALCHLLDVDVTRLVGLSCGAGLTADEAFAPELRMILAPPSQVLHGEAALREVPWPPKGPTAVAGQAFVPLIDEDPSRGLILVLFGQPQVLRQRLQSLGVRQALSNPAADEVLLRLRAQWPRLDGLGPLLGCSPAIELAMRRAQLAAQSAVGTFIQGPAGGGKAELVRSLIAQRARNLDVPANALVAVAIDCRVADEAVAASQLETLAARVHPETPPLASHLVLEYLDAASDAVLAVIDAWWRQHQHSIATLMTSEMSASSLVSRNPRLARLVQAVATLEIVIPPLADRREDVAPLVQHYLVQAAERMGRRSPSLGRQALELLEAYTWPGNAAEVRDAAGEMLVNAVLTPAIQPAHLPLAIRTFGGTLVAGAGAKLEPIVLDHVLEDLERILLERALKLSPRNRARAARLLGISRPRFLRRISQLGLDRPDKNEEAV